MDRDYDIIEYDGLIYERTDDMSALSDFRCGIDEMDVFGIGSSIIRLIVERLMNHKTLLSVSAYIDVDSKYTAEPFYEKCGFRRIGGPLHPMAECVRMLRYLE